MFLSLVLFRDALKTVLGCEHLIWTTITERRVENECLSLEQCVGHFLLTMLESSSTTTSELIDMILNSLSREVDLFSKANVSMSSWSDPESFMHTDEDLEGNSHPHLTVWLSLLLLNISRQDMYEKITNMWIRALQSPHIAVKHAACTVLSFVLCKIRDSNENEIDVYKIMEPMPVSKLNNLLELRLWAEMEDLPKMEPPRAVYPSVVGCYIRVLVSSKRVV